LVYAKLNEKPAITLNEAWEYTKYTFVGITIN
jgi:hypothetical protein